jgi:hypothetical protein
VWAFAAVTPTEAIIPGITVGASDNNGSVGDSIVGLGFVLEASDVEYPSNLDQMAESF